MSPFEPVVTSLLDTDLYKLSMWQPMLHHMAGNEAEYRFVCRNRPELALSELLPEVEAQLDSLCRLRFTDAELDCLSMLRWLKHDFIEFLRIFRLQRRFVHVRAEGDDLQIVARGPQVHVMAFEIYVLAIVNELYFRRLVSGPARDEAFAEGRRRLAAKVRLLREHVARPGPRHPYEFFDFGLRRRFSAAWQDEVVATLARELPQCFKGTSNVHLAMKHGLVPIGTMAHEYLQTFQAMPGVQLRHFQRQALETWVQEYRGDLGIALTDVVGMDAFLADFDLYFAKLFDGLRHDSGDPLAWGEKALAHYARLRIDPQGKRLVFSDALDLPKALALHRHFGDRVQTGFGIGTHLTNDLGPRPLNIVMKLARCNGQPTAKLSDSPGKTLCDDPTFMAYLRQVFRVRA